MERVVTEIYEDDESLLTRKQVAAALRERGFPVSASTLATRASRPGRQGSPPFRKFGATPLYRLSEALAWARSRLSRPASTAAELRRGP
jgi:hypothetical protein